MKRSDIKNMTMDELLHQRKLLTEEWFNLRIQAAIKPLDNPRRIRQIRKDLARINTVLREIQLGIRKGLGIEETKA